MSHSPFKTRNPCLLAISPIDKTSCGLILPYEKLISRFSKPIRIVSARQANDCPSFKGIPAISRFSPSGSAIIPTYISIPIKWKTYESYLSDIRCGYRRQIITSSKKMSPNTDIKIIPANQF
jgi:hypothetical protein